MEKNHGPAASAITRTNWKGSSPERARPSSMYFGAASGRARKIHRVRQVRELLAERWRPAGVALPDSLELDPETWLRSSG